MNNHPRIRSDLRAQRKCKIFQVGEYLLLDILHNGQQGMVFTWATSAGGFPPDAALLQVAHDYGRGCWDLLIGSESFPPCPAGGEFERIPIDPASIRYDPVSDIVQMMVDHGDRRSHYERTGEDLRDSNLKPIAHFPMRHAFDARKMYLTPTPEDVAKRTTLAEQDIVTDDPVNAYEAPKQGSWRDRETLL